MPALFVPFFRVSTPAGFAFMEPVDSYALHHAQLHQADGLRHFKNQFHLYSRFVCNGLLEPYQHNDNTPQALL